MGLTLDTDGYRIQAVPVNRNTFIGTATNEPCSNKVVHAEADGLLTFHFETGNKAITAIAGSDFAASEDCTGVTSIASVIIS